MLLACVGVLVWVTFTAETPIDRLVARPALRIDVTAAQWSWTFRYDNGTTVVAVSTWSPPVAVVPTGVEIEFDGTSRDVIHGFWVPGLHFQRQFVPGFVTKFDLTFATAGLYLGECSVFCGEHHSEMHFAIEAVSGPRFRTLAGQPWEDASELARACGASGIAAIAGRRLIISVSRSISAWWRSRSSSRAACLRW